ncbi:MAG: NAD(P)H-hydrate dehydratase [Pyrinomonadaceae bacterium MAG19_C2-C3]|nr:NAD(P)H-hydrate dehydratase [Pyrinomonadaceae bacterium MAG19_C2-C3]
MPENIKQLSLPVVVTPSVLRRLPLPRHAEGGDKDERGTILIVGGAPQMPGAVILAGVAALRAGAGKLQIATCASIAGLVAAHVPEAYVIALPETKKGAIAPSAARLIARHANEAQAVVIGIGMVEKSSVTALMKHLVPQLKTPVIVLDAVALTCFKRCPNTVKATESKVIMTPHAGEMASLLGITKDEVLADAEATARHASERFGAVIALKGSQTFIVDAQDNKAYCNRCGNIGLATSGSGDTLSGIIGGLAARTATPLIATVWGVFLHARAGDRLAKRVGGLGFLARELLAEIPGLMEKLDAKKTGKKRAAK